MPIEIREMVVRATVRDDARNDSPTATREPSASSQQTTAADEQLQQVAELVQEALRRRKER